ncbi:protein S100-A6-like [Sphaerodactylus townsendi]|uniref:Uncharacterized protein n=1 Tax=Sphaerodactylus townsendi TaxID=933632 RepID=A0ACB8G810_9SAUR|nr:protein S100-A6-like [Sphaerodactylus townsendi]
MASRIDMALGTLVAAFHDYAKKHNDGTTINKKELKELIEKEVSLGQKVNDKEIQGLMGDLDRNGDEKLDFKEYLTLLGRLAVHYNEGLKGAH